MIRVDIRNISDKQYEELIEYVTNCCNAISFHFPGIDYDKKPLLDKEWQQYHKNIQPFLHECLNHGAKIMYSKHYQKMKLGTYSIIIHVKLFDRVKKMLYSNHLYDWDHHNDLPEDVCFFNQKQLRVFSCSHDEDFIMLNEDNNDISFLKSKNIQFWIQ